MADRPQLIAVGLVLASVPLLGAGFVNGDAAAYCAQASSAELGVRSVHVGYLALAAWLATLSPEHLPWLLDATSLVASALAVCGAAHLARRTGGAPTLAALGAAAAVLPRAPFAEVDPLWVAAVLWAAAGQPASMVAAVLVSPVALLALPWVVAEAPRKTRPWVVGLSVVTVAGLVVATGGDWLWGPRGVLHGGAWSPGVALQGWTAELPWLIVPLLLLAPRQARSLVLLAPLLLAPPDVPTWTLGGVALAVVASRAGGLRPAPWAWVLVALAVPVAFSGAVSRARAVRTTQATITQAVARLGPHDGLVAPWSWGARASVVATGRVYGLRWRAEPPVDDQIQRWCADPPAHTWRLDHTGLTQVAPPSCDTEPR